MISLRSRPFFAARSISGSNKTLSRSSYRIRWQFIITIKTTFPCAIQVYVASVVVVHMAAVTKLSLSSRKFNYSISLAQYCWSGYLNFQFPSLAEWEMKIIWEQNHLRGVFVHNLCGGGWMSKCFLSPSEALHYKGSFKSFRSKAFKLFKMRSQVIFHLTQSSSSLSPPTPDPRLHRLSLFLSTQLKRYHRNRFLISTFICSFRRIRDPILKDVNSIIRFHACPTVKRDAGERNAFIKFSS